MPYASNSELPDAVRNALPAEAQDTWRQIFNNAEKQYNDEGKAAATAWAGLKNAGWTKEEDNWVKKQLTDAQRTPPEAAKNNAKRALRWREEHGDEVKGMTDVGWTRARQLADGGPLSMETISRMAQFNRHRQNATVAPEFKDTPWRDNGYVAWLGWGGDSGINWAISVSGSVNKEFLHKDAQKRYTLGVVYEPDVLDAHDEYMEAEEIEKTAWEFMRKLQSKVNKTALDVLEAIVKALDDGPVTVDVTDIYEMVQKAGLNDMHRNTPMDEALGEIVETYVTPVDMVINGEFVRKNTWMMGIVWSPEYFTKIQNGERTGLSMEGRGRRVVTDAP